MNEPKPSDFGNFDPSANYEIELRLFESDREALLSPYIYKPGRNKGILQIPSFLLFYISGSIVVWWFALCLLCAGIEEITGTTFLHHIETFGHKLWFIPAIIMLAAILLPLLSFVMDQYSRFRPRKIPEEVKSQVLELERKIAVSTAMMNAKSKYSSALEQYQLELAETGENWWKDLSGYELEKAVARMLNRLGYSATVTKQSGDGGVDVIAQNSSHTLLIQCKGWNTKIGVRPVRELLGVVTDSKINGTVAVMLSTNGFTEEASNFANRNRVLLLDARSLSEIAVGRMESLHFKDSD
ncbi:MAG: restriction endonuclease [Candidatus Zixiibacteriota bacterium]